MKSVTSDDNPITNRSPVFWKTLYNWLQYVLNGDLPIEKTVFRLIVIAEKNIINGSLVTEFDKANTIELATLALLNAKKELWGKKEDKRDGISDSYCDYLNAFFDPQHEDIVCQLILKMSIVLFESDYDEKLRKKFNNIPGLFSEFSDYLYTDMFGWVMEKVVAQCKMGKPAYISKYDFDTVLAGHSRAYNQTASIPALSTEIDEAVASATVKKSHPDTYIQQLELIEADFTEKCKAAKDYLRTKEEIIRRAEKGLFIPSSLNDYSDKLVRSWSNARIRTSLSSGTDIEKGALLFSEVSSSALEMRLQGTDLPSFFGSGKLHDLANVPKEKPAIGWHPQYEALLNGGKENE
jgi:hypothetical protein